MKLVEVLENLNSFEKNSFLKIIDSIVSEEPKNLKKIEEIIINTKDLKNTDNQNIAKVFQLIRTEYKQHISSEFVHTSSQLDIIIDILIRDANCMISYDWFSRLYENELKKIKKKVSALKKELESDSNERSRDYKIYKACVETAYLNDELNNQEKKITTEELSILIKLAEKLELSQEEVKLINYTILPLEKKNLDDLINDLKNSGVIFYSRKHNTIYVADEVVKVLREVRGKEIADKYMRRVLKKLKPSHLNLVCKKHNIDWRLEFEDQIKEIINEGISIRTILSNDIHKPGTKLTEIKSVFNDVSQKQLNIGSIKGSTIEEKLDSLIQYFDQLEKDDKVGISIEGYEKLLIDVYNDIPKSKQILKKTFDFPDEVNLDADKLMNYNIKPRDIIEVFNEAQIKSFCEKRDISKRGDEILNILDAYKDADNLLIENYTSIAYRDYNELKENGLEIKESDLGVKFEDVTKSILEELGFNVDEEARKAINTKKDKIDIIVNVGNNDVIIVECKTIKDKKYNKFSSVSRQLKSYKNNAAKKDYNVIKSLLIGPEFSDDFISECELEYELNLSLIEAQTLYEILEGFKNSSLSVFPYNLFMRDVLIQSERVVKALKK